MKTFSDCDGRKGTIGTKITASKPIDSLDNDIYSVQEIERGGRYGTILRFSSHPWAWAYSKNVRIVD